jgi:hypothetical protein
MEEFYELVRDKVIIERKRGLLGINFIATASRAVTR